jgi:transglutaminase-like putative cysteine protease
MNSIYLKTTPMLDFENQQIQTLIESRGWQQLNEYDAIKSIYNFVRDEIVFAYNFDDTLSASQVLVDGYGQCNTKGTLLMALLRALNIPCRLHGFTIYNELQKGAIPSYLFVLAPKRIIHSWVEVFYNEEWLNLEGYILDKKYLSQIQAKFAKEHDDFSAYGVATNCLKNPQIEWQGGSTYIQKQGIADDYGVYDHPDDFYQMYGSNLKGIKRFLFRYLFRFLMNYNVNKIRRIGIK